MHNYDFHESLSEEEFQRFAKDIIEIRDNIKLFTTSKGKDGGIDFYDENHTIMGQVKNNKNVSDLLKQLKNEIKKVEKQNPKRYILVVSNKLSIHTRNKILSLFKAYLKEKDLIDQTELNSLLDNNQYNTIEKKYLKSLMANSFVLVNTINQVINKETFEKTNIELDKIQRTKDVFVKGNNYNQAIKILEEKKSIIISGEPGIGKTALGHALIIYLSNKFNDINFISVRKVEELYKLFNEAEKQVFFFDDFWGDISKNVNVTSLQQNELLEFMNYLNKFDNKFLILTTREYIFNEGLQLNTKITNEIKFHKFLLELKEENRIFKFDILYNHLQVSGFSWTQIKIILDYWERIINHHNYNPRIIASYFEYCQKNNIQTEGIKFIKDFLDYLDEPYTFWTDIFEKQTYHSKIILMLLALTINDIAYYNLKDLFYKIEPSTLQNEFNIALEQLETTFTITNKTDSITLSLKNPSFKDFLINYLENHFEEYGKKLASIPLDFNAYLKLLEIVNNEPFTNIKKELEEIISQNIISYLENNVPINYFDYFKKGKYSSNTSMLRLLESILEITDFNKNIILKNYINNYWECIQDNLDDYLTIKDDNYYFFPFFLKELSQKQKIDNGYEIIWQYYNFLFDYGYSAFERFIYFKEIFPQDFELFMKNYRHELRRNFEYIIIEYVQDTVQEDNDYILDEIDEEIEPLFKKYGFRFTKQLRDKLSEITSQLQYQNISSNDDLKEWKKEYQKEEKEKKELKKLINKKAETLLGKNNTITNEQIKKIIKRKKLSAKYEAKIINIIENDCSFLDSLIHNKNTLIILIDYLNDKKEMPKNVIDFFDYFIENESEEVVGLLKVIAVGVMMSNKTLFMPDDIKKALKYAEPYNYSIEKLLVSKYFYKRGNWYQFIHPFLHIYLALKVNFPMIYPHIINYLNVAIDLWSEQGKYYSFHPTIIYNIFVDYNSKYWFEWIVKEELESFFEKIDTTTEESIAISILKYFNLSYQLHDEGFSYSYENTFLIDLLEIHTNLFIEDIFGDWDKLDKILKTDLIKLSNNGEIILNNHLDNSQLLEVLKRKKVIKYLNDNYNKIKEYYNTQLKGTVL